MAALSLLERLRLELLTGWFHPRLDVEFAKNTYGLRLRFVRDRPVTTVEVAGLVVELATRAERWLSRQGFGADDGEEDHGDDDDALPLMQAASVQWRSAVAGGQRAHRFQVHQGLAYALPPRCAAWRGYTLHGGVAVGGRAGRERLCRYLARPALARGRLGETPTGLIRVTVKRPWADVTAGVTSTPLEFVERRGSGPAAACCPRTIPRVAVTDTRDRTWYIGHCSKTWTR
ncbi:MAG: hypothetical protein ACJAZO_002278 [Myxococcota bacterium]|jgi:hypothetical protein